MKFTCLIIDDEQPARELLEQYVKKVPQLELIQSCKNAMEAIEAINSHQVDLIFLDIQMPDLTGIEMIKTLRNQPATIFTTAYQEFALEGYQLNVVDYLLKPFPFTRFIQAVNKACNGLEIGTTKKGKDNSVESKDESMVIKAEHKLYKVEISNILFIEGLREYVTYHLVDRKIISLQALKDIDLNLRSHGFVRVHKSFIVNKHWVEVLDGNRLKIGERSIPVGAAYKEIAVKGIFEK
ncbi:MAG: response regulator transcription factor [Reichenbachiella sp.]|uniref:LytR/AlgR family response regulator transcription factor n=1 Tax=Reichenbachiella sp. TaxID=2184521 RepID=UPI0032661E7D